MNNLILSTVGDDSYHHHWIKGLTKAHLWLVYYGDSDENFEKYSKQCDKIIRMKGHKYPLLLPTIISKFEQDIAKYRHVWLPDDDVKIDGTSIDLMFSLAAKNNLNLCQPSLWPAKNISHPDLVTHVSPRSLIRLNTVEPQAPCFSTKFLLKIYKELFHQSFTGWGLDFVWGWFLRNDPELEYNPCLINCIYMEHMRPVMDVYDDDRKQKAIDDTIKLIEKYKVPKDHLSISKI